MCLLLRSICFRMKYKQLYFNKLEQKEDSAKKYAEMELLENKIKEIVESIDL